MNEDYHSIWSYLMDVPFTQDWVTANGLRTRYIRAGQRGAPVVIMLHGIAGSWEGFCANIKAHAEHFDVIAFDMMGSGFSDKPVQDHYAIRDYADHLAAVMDALDVARASFIGVSLGSWIAARFAHDYPQRTERMIFTAVSGLVRLDGTGAAAGAAIAQDRLTASDDPTWDNVSRVFHDLIRDPTKRMADFVKVRQAVYRLPDMQQAMHRILAVTAGAINAANALPDEEWRAIEAPVLLISATDDSPFFQRNALRAEKLLPNAEVAEMKNVAHWAQFEDAESFNRLSIAFLRR